MVDVSTGSTGGSITVTGGSQINSVTATPDTARYWSSQSEMYAEQSKESAKKAEQVKEEVIKQKDITQSYVDEAKNWANKLGDTVDGVEYSAKHYAELTADRAESALTDIDTAKNTSLTEIGTLKTNSLSEITTLKNTTVSTIDTGLENINTAKTNAISDITTQKNTSIGEVTAEGNKQKGILQTTGQSYVDDTKHYADVSKTQADISTSKTNEVVESANNALEDIATSKTNALSEITTLANNSKSELSTLGTNATENIETAETNAITNITNTKNTSVSDIETLGNEKIELATSQANIATTKASQASQSASNALKSANNSKISETNAKESENNALASTNTATSQANIATNQARIATEQAQIAKDEVAKLSNVYEFKGSVPTFDDLPANAQIGDVYDTQDTGMNYAWTGEKWDELGGTFDISWGSIKGDITTQIDLQSALNEKVDNSTLLDYVTETELNNKGYLTEHQSLEGYATEQWVENKGYLTSVPAEYVTDTELNAKGYLTQHQDISNLATKVELSNGLATKQPKGNYALKSDIPDVSNFITEVPGEYVTDTELKEALKNVDSSSSGLPIGTIIPVDASVSYVPYGILPCDGAEYTQAQFSDLYANYIETGYLVTCTYTEYEVELNSTGSCYKFAVDSVNQKFRVPFIPDKVLVDIADTIGVKGNGMVIGLTNGTKSGGFQTFYDGNAGTVTSAQEQYYGLNLPQPEINTVTGKLQGGLGLVSDTSKSGIEADAATAKRYKTIRHFIVVSNGQTNQSMMDWSAWASSLQGKANIDLSNLSEAGKKVIDGQWNIVPDYPLVFSSTTAGDYTIDISDYLPQDNYIYEIMFASHSYNSSSTQKNMFIGTDLLPITPEPNAPVKLLTDSDVVKLERQTAVLTTLNRTVVVKIAGGTLNEATVRLIAYRRMGTNQ